MMYLAKELVTNNGMSAPAWAFFTALISIVGAILRELIKTRNQTVDRLNALEQRFERVESRLSRYFEDDHDVRPRPRRPRK